MAGIGYCSATMGTVDFCRCYRRYISFVVDTPPTYKQFMANLEEKMADPDFTGDTVKLLRPGITFDPATSWKLVRETLIEKLR